MENVYNVANNFQMHISVVKVMRVCKNAVGCGNFEVHVCMNVHEYECVKTFFSIFNSPKKIRNRNSLDGSSVQSFFARDIVAKAFVVNKTCECLQLIFSLSLSLSSDKFGV